MTKQEQQRMTRLEIENRELKAQHAKYFEIYRNSLIEIIELKATIELIQSAIGE